jgi:hypothetical protein
VLLKFLYVAGLGPNGSQQRREGAIFYSHLNAAEKCTHNAWMLSFANSDGSGKVCPPFAVLSC